MSDRGRWVNSTSIVGAALFAGALLLRLWHLWSSAAGPTFLAPVVDSETYDRLARGLASGDGLTHEFFWQPVFYPLFLSAVYGVAGSSIVVAKVVQAVVGAATCLLTYRLGEAVFDRRAGVLAGATVALYGPAIFFDGELLATGWAAFWSVALLLLFLRAGRTGGTAVHVGLGVCGALSVITRPTFLPFFVVGCGWLWLVARGKPGGAWGKSALVLAGFLAVAAPVALMSRSHTDRLDILPASGGLNLHIGNNPDAARTIAIRPGWDWKELTNLPRRHGVTRRSDTGRFFRARVLDYVLGDPVEFAWGLVLKSGHFFCSRELPRNIDAYVLRDSSTPLRLLLWKTGGFGFPFGVLLVFAVTGAVLCYERLPAPLRWFLLLYPLSVVLVFVSARYRTPVVPALAVVAAGGCLAVPRAIAAGRWPRVVVAATVALLALVLSTVPGPYPQEAANYRAELEYFLGTRAMNEDDLESAESRLRRAVELQANHGDAHNHLGIVYSRMRKLTPATEHFERAVESNGRSATARTNLARLYAARGRMDEALEQFRVAVELDPFDIDLHRHFGLTLMKLRRFDEAAEHLRLVVGARPEDTASRAALDRAVSSSRP